MRERTLHSLALIRIGAPQPVGLVDAEAIKLRVREITNPDVQSP